MYTISKNPIKPIKPKKPRWVGFFPSLPNFHGERRSMKTKLEQLNINDPLSIKLLLGGSNQKIKNQRKIQEIMITYLKDTNRINEL